jgi:hypothetical protein
MSSSYAGVISKYKHNLGKEIELLMLMHLWVTYAVSEELSDTEM